jgi:hypothetical protein
MFVKLSRYLPGNPLLQGSSNTKSTNIGMIIGLVMGGILTLVIIICLVLFIQYKFQNIKTKEMTSTDGHLQMMKSVPGAKPFSFVEVVLATDNFKIQIGKGGFGPVYYGKLENGQEVAIKVRDVKSSQGPSEFLNEVCEFQDVLMILFVVELGCEDNKCNSFTHP